jgi:Flp pilus assembly protein TadD
MAAQKSKDFCHSMSWPILLLASCVALAGCQNKSASLDSDSLLTTASTEPASLRETADLGRRWQKDPADMRLGLAYAGHLKSLDQTEQQLQVLKTLVSHHPNDQRLMVVYGKQLAEAGQEAQAEGVLEQAVAAGSKDWKIYSALGSALDQQGKYAEARQNYEQALKLEPNQITVLNNMGMSYALEGNLPKAEETLRQANQLPAGRTEPRIRQNLALVVGLQGRFDEARQIASQDLPAEQVEANVAYLQKMLSQPDTWKQLQQGSSTQG